MNRPRQVHPWSGKLASAITALLLVLSACSDTGTAPKAASLSPSAAHPSLNLIGGGAWSGSGPGTVTLHNNGSTGDPSMSYALSGYGTVFSPQNWTFTSTSTTSGAVTVNYTYSGFHAFFMVHAWLYARVTTTSGTTETQLVNAYAPGCCSSPSNGFTYSGSYTFHVQPGDVFGFRMGGYNYDSDARLLGTLTLSQPDNTPPVITPSMSGTLGNNGWYTSNVGLTWSVTDPESAISAESGCDAASVTSDTPGTSLTCTATSAGGTSSASVNIKRDATPPVINFSGNAGTYTVDQTVAITCAASDVTSGLASSACPGASGDAYTFGVGSHTLNASAQDKAGNAATNSTTFTVTATPGSVCALVKRWVSQHGVANSMCQQLANGAYGAFANHVSAQSGKTVSAANAAILITLAGDL